MVTLPRTTSPRFPPPFAQPQPQPLDLGSSFNAFFVSGPNLGIQLGRNPIAWFPFVAIASVTLKRAWSWGQGALWLVFAALAALGGSTGATLGTFSFCAALCIVTAHLRRSYSLVFVLRDGRRQEVAVNVGYPPGALTFKSSPWIARFDAGWRWLAHQLAAHRVQVIDKG
jgi:hypothetical protein